MNLEEHYNKLYRQSVSKIETDNYEIDRLIDSENDMRFGITLLIRPNETTKNNIQRFLTEVKQVEPNQYYYQNSDIHVTLMSIISCYNGFKLADINPSDYIAIINNVLKTKKKFDIHFRGLTASPSCVLLKGFFEEHTMNDIRDELRSEFKASLLQQSLDRRYVIRTAHSTIIRFKEELVNKNAFLGLIEKYKDFDFGTFEVKNIELVYNDWYQRAQFVQSLHNFELRSR